MIKMIYGVVFFTDKTPKGNVQEKDAAENKVEAEGNVNIEEKRATQSGNKIKNEKREVVFDPRYPSKKRRKKRKKETVYDFDYEVEATEQDKDGHVANKAKTEQKKDGDAANERKTETKSKARNPINRNSEEYRKWETIFSKIFPPKKKG